MNPVAFLTENGLKQIKVTVLAEGRDKGKVFLVTEMPAMKADKWTWRMRQAIERAGGAVPKEIADMGIVGLMLAGIHNLGIVPWPELEPLLDEMLSTTEVVENPENPGVTRKWIEQDFREVSTIQLIRKEWLTLHGNFTSSDDL